MTLAELISKRIYSSSSSNKKNDDRTEEIELNQQENHLKPFQRLQNSILNILPNLHAFHNERIKRNNRKTNIQRTNSSIIKSPINGQTNSKKTVTFSSVFDLVDNSKSLEHFGDFNFGFLEENTSKSDLELNKQDEETDECYPPSADSKTQRENSVDASTSTDLITRQTFVRRQSSRVRKNSKKTNIRSNKIDRSTSVPEMCTSIQEDSSDSQGSKLSHIRKWFKSSSFNRFLHSFQVQTQKGTDGIAKVNRFISIRSKTRPKSVEVIY